MTKYEKEYEESDLSSVSGTDSPQRYTTEDLLSLRVSSIV